MARIIFAFADSREEANTSFHRCFYPARILAETGRHSITVMPILDLLHPNPPQELRDAVEQSNVIVLERLLTREFHSKIVEWREQEKFIAATFDDNYGLMPPSGGQPHRTWRGGRKATVGHNSDGSEKKGAILNEFRDGLRLVNTALVPSKVLADDYRPFCSDMRYVPNVPYLPLWQNLKKRPPDNNFVIGWGGSSAHSESWLASGLPQALGIICKRFPRVHIHIQSRDPRILILLDKANLQGRYTSAMWIPFDSWPSAVAQWDLGVMPLTEDGYDLRRSYLKAWENALGGNAWVATEGPVYTEAKGGILVANKVEAWVKALSLLIESREERERLAQEGREWAMSLWNGSAEMYEKALSLK